MINIKKFFQTVGLLIVLVVLINGCKKADFIINTQPDSITASTVDYKTVLPASLVVTANIEDASPTNATLQKYLGFWARSGSFQTDGEEETYQFGNDFRTDLWFNNYSNANNYNFIQGKAKAAGAGIYEGIARIMKVKNFQMIVDVFGNAPYFQALRGTDFRTPKYDDDEEIYKDLLKQLDTALVLLKDPTLSSAANNPEIAKNDLVYQGNTTRWRQFANTLRLRLIIHTCNTSFAGNTETNSIVSSISQTAEMAKITADGAGFIAAGQSAKLNPGFDASKPNPFYVTYERTAAGALSGQFNFVKANAYATGPNPTAPGQFGYYDYNGDPRKDRFYSLPLAAGSTVHRGIPYGLLSGNAANNGDRLSGVNGPGIIPQGAATPAWIFTSVESLFLQAEAARRGLLPVANTVSLYTAAVTESFVYLGLTAAQANTYLTGNATYPDVDITNGSNGNGIPPGIYTIISQKWFALNALSTLEVYTDYRRTNMPYGIGSGYPQGPPISVSPNKPASVTSIPIRLFYPQEEYQFNGANVVAEGTINVFTAGGVSGRNRIFWDKN